MMSADVHVRAAEAAVAAEPFLKWAGGKRQLLPELRKYVPSNFRRYYEPFIGGAALYFALSPRMGPFAYVIGDANKHLTVTYEAVRSSPEKVIVELAAHARKHSEPYYYRQRAIGFHGSSVERAARFIYINRVCFNGLYRENKSGEFNVPFGDYKNPRILDAEGLRKCSKALEGVRIHSGDFTSTCADAKAGDFVYFDPPYVPRPKEDASESDFTQYTRDGFTLDDQRRLVSFAAQLKKRGVHVLLSNADVPIVHKLYKGFKIHRVSARRNINSKVDKRGPVGEVIIT